VAANRLHQKADVVGIYVIALHQKDDGVLSQDFLQGGFLEKHHDRLLRRCRHKQ
jgi:hypothetical protein